MTILRRLASSLAEHWAKPLAAASLSVAIGSIPAYAGDELGLAMARRIADATIAHAREYKLRPMCVVVLGADGGTVMVQREDGMGAGNCKVVEAKAATAFEFRMPTAVLAGVFGKDAAQTAALSAALDGHFVVIAGGRPIFDADNRFLGAIAAGGDKSDQDDASVVAGLASAGLFGEKQAANRAAGEVKTR